MSLTDFEGAIWPKGWRQYRAEQKKTHLEDIVGKVLEMAIHDGDELSEWQRAKLLWALGSLARGLYDLAAHELRDALANEGVAPNPWPNNEAKPAGLADLTPKRLREILDSVKRLPAREFPIFR